MWTFLYLGGVPFDTLRRVDGVGAAPRRSRGRRRESRARAARADTRRERRGDGVGARETRRQRREGRRRPGARRIRRASPTLTGTPSTRWRGHNKATHNDATQRDNATRREKHHKKTHTGPRHPRPPEAAEAHVDVLRVLPRDVGRFTLYGRRGKRLRYSGGQLDRPVRPAG